MGALSRHHTAASIGALAVLVGLVLALSASAVSGAKRIPFPPCPKQTLCVFEHDNFEGQRVKIGGTGVSNKLADEMNNQASSYYNRRGRVSFLYVGRNAEGERECAAPREAETSLPGFNDLASSTKLTKKRTVCPGA